MTKVKEGYSDTRPLGSPNSWANSYGSHLAGKAAIDGADHAAITMENKWGAGRLRLLVDTAMREKFDKQRFKLNAAIWHGDLAEVQTEAQRMVNAWIALDRAAEAAGASVLSPEVWEVTLPDGSVAAIVPDQAAAHGVMAQGRQVTVYTLEEIAVMLGNYREVVKVKEAFPGSTVEAIRRTIDDPLNGLRDGRRLEDTLDDDVPAFGN
jgi:hypothetical protein